ncbi:RagB/SusD family nutrient uptake outer membrane protein [Niabella beijingensis]|uniref:RagB/SusD family nutrient uptake outer membrane protein n=1 Tax=Niabella beijingensis TaxID=2872700 RepID=UPI001CBCF243|nr:RagB/SusD family nutrient uptake outer membrane protein [Niabella beijingensis]MBZ4188609.1 RagB/SusD family nutrient uptake outer membrane protein [Niabella beijingensis]
MKKYYIIILALVALLNSACNKSFLDRRPLDATTSDVFFETPDQMRTYINSFYSSANFPQYANHGSDFDSDNEVNNSPNTRLQGTRVVATSGTISFADVRRINFFFDNYHRVKDGHELSAYQQYLGEAYFFRALIYYKLLQSYGAIQIVTKELTTESAELYNPRDPRDKVADFIIDQLDSAVTYLMADKTSGAGRINKWIALLFQSRVALYEGTWEKYHAGTPFGVENADPEKYFTIAAAAAEQVINSNIYKVYSTGNPRSDYKSFFSLLDYATNSEMMFWRKYDNNLTGGDAAFVNTRFYRMATPDNNTVTKQLADAYLCSDGKPITDNPLFNGYNTLAQEGENRDPRFTQTIAMPDQIWKINSNGSTENWSVAYGRLNSTAAYNAPCGYIIQKGYNPNTAYHVQQYEESPGIIYRYAEVLLNYAEAKAELGTITQEDIDKSIKLLRDRVGMPNLLMSAITTDPKWDFPELSPLINEIRRERRVELAAEGFRWDDIARWAAADELIVGSRPKGFKASQITKNPFPVDEQGFLDPFQESLPSGYGFKLDRDYLNSIPESEILLNDNLKQNPGW